MWHGSVANVVYNVALSVCKCTLWHRSFATDIPICNAILFLWNSYIQHGTVPLQSLQCDTVPLQMLHTTWYCNFTIITVWQCTLAMQRFCISAIGTWWHSLNHGIESFQSLQRVDVLFQSLQRGTVPLQMFYTTWHCIFAIYHPCNRCTTFFCLCNWYIVKNNLKNLIHVFNQHCPLLKFSFPDFSLSSLDILTLSWHKTNQVWVSSQLTYFYRSYCPLLKFCFPDIFCSFF